MSTQAPESDLPYSFHVVKSRPGTSLPVARRYVVTATGAEYDHSTVYGLASVICPAPSAYIFVPVSPSNSDGERSAALLGCSRLAVELTNLGALLAGIGTSISDICGSPLPAVAVTDIRYWSYEPGTSRVNDL